MDAIYEVGGELSLVITLKDSQAVNKSGRVYLDEFCRDRDVPLHKSSHINNDDCIEAIKAHSIDWLFIIGWSQIANMELLNSPSRGVLGMHPTLLPVGRGRAAIPWAILKGVEKTGVTLFKLDEGVDTGPVLGQKEIGLDENSDASWLYQEVDNAHIALMKDLIPKIMNDQIELLVQDESQASIWEGRKPEDGLINLNGSAFEANRLVRAVTHPYPGAFLIRDGKKVIVWKSRIHGLKDVNIGTHIKFKDGLLEIIEYQEIDTNN